MTDAKDEENSCLSITDDVKRADYYHGLVPRADIEPLLKKEGDFLFAEDRDKRSNNLGTERQMGSTTFSGDGATTLVAVKTMREEMSREARLKFMKEARLMRKLSHRNIVRILGVAVHEQPLMIVMELCPGGSLLNYLRKNKGKLTQATKLRFAFEASAGLAYLEQQNFIHRDIAARNCLLTEKHELKISDFGMSDERKELTDDKLDKVPVWEIYADGQEPYPGLSNIQTRAKIIVQNYRMEMPKDTPTSIAKIVNSCWAKDPADRPSFQKIHEYIKEKK
ncbi:Tyrosine-protein kinase [Aphelenchoides besseyi]|nr:Tyrosine-protein kinase [Aphelenchoides besseyi]